MRNWGAKAPTVTERARALALCNVREHELAPGFEHVKEVSKEILLVVGVTNRFLRDDEVELSGPLNR